MERRRSQRGTQELFHLVNRRPAGWGFELLHFELYRAAAIFARDDLDSEIERQTGKTERVSGGTLKQATVTSAERNDVERVAHLGNEVIDQINLQMASQSDVSVHSNLVVTVVLEDARARIQSANLDFNCPDGIRTRRRIIVIDRALVGCVDRQITCDLDDSGRVARAQHSPVDHVAEQFAITG